MKVIRDESYRRKKLGFTLKIQKLIGASYAFDTGVLSLFALTGEVSWILPFAYLLFGIAHFTGFALTTRFRVNARKSNVLLVGWQMAFGSIVHLAFAAIAPEIGVMFLLALFVIFGFGALIQPLRHCVIGWALTAAALAIQIGYFGIQHSLPSNATGLHWIFWLVFVGSLGRVIMLGVFALSFRDSLNQKNQELSVALAKNHLLATTDDLTGALNRRSMMSVLSQEIERASRYNLPLSVAMLDLDNFKLVNDRFGHLIGDAVLKRFSLLAGESLRAADCFGRFGGEEFFVVLPHCSQRNSVKIMERYRNTVLQYSWAEVKPELSVSVSIGVATYEPGSSVDLLLSRADAALYDAKRSGRNQTCSSNDAIGDAISLAS